MSKKKEENLFRGKLLLYQISVHFLTSRYIYRSKIGNLIFVSRETPREVEGGILEAHYQNVHIVIGSS